MFAHFSSQMQMTRYTYHSADGQDTKHTHDPVEDSDGELLQVCTDKPFAPPAPAELQSYRQTLIT